MRREKKILTRKQKFSDVDYMFIYLNYCIKFVFYD